MLPCLKIGGEKGGEKRGIFPLLKRGRLISPANLMTRHLLREKKNGRGSSMAFVRAACLRCTREGDGKDRVPIVLYNYLSNPRESSIQIRSDQIRSDQPWALETKRFTHFLVHTINSNAIIWPTASSSNNSNILCRFTLNLQLDANRIFSWRIHLLHHSTMISARSFSRKIYQNTPSQGRIARPLMRVGSQISQKQLHLPAIVPSIWNIPSDTPHQQQHHNQQQQRQFSSTGGIPLIRLPSSSSTTSLLLSSSDVNQHCFSTTASSSSSSIHSKNNHKNNNTNNSQQHHAIHAATLSSTSSSVDNNNNNNNNTPINWNRFMFAFCNFWSPHKFNRNRACWIMLCPTRMVMVTR